MKKNAPKPVNSNNQKVDGSIPSLPKGVSGCHPTVSSPLNQSSTPLLKIKASPRDDDASMKEILATFIFYPQRINPLEEGDFSTDPAYHVSPFIISLLE